MIMWKLLIFLYQINQYYYYAHDYCLHFLNSKLDTRKKKS